MGSPTVREVWRLALPAETRLLGGEEGLSRPVLWARRMAATPPAFAALEVGDIALLSAEAIPLLDERLTLAQVTAGLAEGDAAAVAVAGDVPQETVAVATGHDLPLFTLPPSTDLRDVERAVIRLIVEREAQLERRGRDIYRRLAQLSIENRGLSAIAEALLEVTGKGVVIQDERLSVLAQAWPQEGAPFDTGLADETALRRWLWGRRLDSKAPPLTTIDLPAAGGVRLVAAIVVEGQLGGYLSLFDPASVIDELDRLAVERGALVCAVELAKQRAVEAAEDRLRGDLLDLILTAGPAQERTLARRAAEAGYELDHFHAAVIFSPGHDVPQAAPLLIREFRAQLLNSGVQAFLCSYGEHLAALCSAKETAPLRQLDERVRATRDRLEDMLPQARIAVGIGRPGRGLDGLRRSFVQAEEALRLAQRLFKGNRILPFSDLGLYRLLCQLQDRDELEAFYEQTLGPLERYDASRNTELVETLEAFFAHHGNVSQTAESLHLHRNSLLYRLERIAEISALDLDDADDRFALQLALKVRPLLSDI